jgi:hypothetical protein
MGKSLQTSDHADIPHPAFVAEPSTKPSFLTD